MTRQSSVFGYVRVSTSGQALDGISLDNQVAKIQGYCELNNLKLVSIIKDEGISAKTLSGRPQAQDMIQQAIRHKHGIVVYKLDRMFRNTVDALTTIQQLDKAGISFHSINEKLDTSSAMGRFFLTMLAALAELERNVVSERTRDAMQNKKAQGFRVGNIPFGWSPGSSGDDLVKHDGEQKTLRLIRSLRTRGESFQTIADHLNSKGLRTRKGGQFKKQNVHQILQYSTNHAVLQ